MEAVIKRPNPQGNGIGNGSSFSELLPYFRRDRLFL
jgi:hypothetical protein